MPRPNLEIVADLYSALARPDLPRIAELVSPNLVIRQAEALPWGGEYEGLAGFRAFTQRLLAAISPRVTIAEYVEAGDHVVTLDRTAGHVLATGAPFDVRLAHVWTLAGGLVTRFEPYIDTPAMLRALGTG